MQSASENDTGTNIGELCKELGVTRQTLYRHVSPTGELRLDGKKVLGIGA
ncbi:helix-turn-helix domain-containing protein [Enteractinococcus helveticum]